jgi:hypothetical protein
MMALAVPRSCRASQSSASACSMTGQMRRQVRSRGCPLHGGELGGGLGGELGAALAVQRYRLGRLGQAAGLHYLRSLSRSSWNPWAQSLQVTTLRPWNVRSRS